jgi:predicted XRE-type DNA-binding protein
MGLPNSEQELIKAQLALQIYSLLKGSGMTQVEIGKILGVRSRRCPCCCGTGRGIFRWGG